MQRLVPLICCLVSLSVATAAEDTAELRVKLDKIYSEWRSALLAQNLKAWQTCTTTFRQVTTHNMIVSQRQRYPDAVFVLPVTPPDTLKLKLQEVEAVGDTAHLIYFGKIDLGLGDEVKDIPENLIVLKFFKEKAGWKFDSTKFINLADNPDMREACKRGNPEFLKNPPFNPPGVVPAVPKICKEPEKVAALRVQAIGYEVLATVNGYEGVPVVNSAEQQLIIGGLNRGDNTLKLQVKSLPVPEGEEHYLQIEAVHLTGEEKNPVVRVFEWTPKTPTVPPVVDLNIAITNGTLKGI
jgi:hypothetical protein